MPDRIYIETTIVSYLRGRPSSDVVIAGHQQTTHEWWGTRRTSYELCTSEAVLEEAASGDPEAAQERIEVLNATAFLATTADAMALADALVEAGALPENAADDALHIAVCADHGIPISIDLELPAFGERGDAANHRKSLCG